ncbi:MAG TPA: ATP-binding protein, partial [Lachnospiraceae bacterium]|nr:ATP-binding protein [Lachnospiraceae bacterium]
MSETGFQIFNKIFELGAVLLYAICLTLFFRPLLPVQKHRRPKLFLIFAVFPAVDRICEWSGAPQGTTGLLLMAVLTAISGILELEKATTFLLTLLFWNTRISSALMAESLYFLADRHWPISFELPGSFFLRSAALLTMLFLSHAVLLAVMLYILQWQMTRQHLPLHRGELCYSSLIPLMGILFGQMISRLLFEPGDGVLLQLYERHPAFLAAVPLLAFLFYMGTCLTIRFQQGMALLQEEQAANFVERQQTRAIQARIREMEQFYTRVRQMKHEMRGHLTNIRGMVRSRAYADLYAYISKMDENLHDFELALQTGNPVTDVIINDKRQQCLDRGIRFRTDFHYPDTEMYDAFDMGIILQNLLQNALEACQNEPKGKRFISLTGKRKGRFFLIETSNYFTGRVAWRADGLPVSTKKEAFSMHGIGLS